MPNPTNNKLVDSKTIAALFDMTPRRVPVSYTHLDVYKRQAESRPKSATGSSS